jgi:UDP-N-acetylmuramoyl-tripeptide--D-alanyl-D-alanine ligase
MSENRLEVKRQSPLVINDAYNANPESMKVGLDTLSELRSYAYRWTLVLGDMLELGEECELAHRKVLEQALRLSEVLHIKQLLLLGDDFKAAYAIISPRVSCVHFDSQAELKNYLLSLSTSPDEAFYFKASNGLGLLPIVKDFLEKLD